MSHEMRWVPLFITIMRQFSGCFRTPLNSVVVLSDLLLEAQLDPVLYECLSSHAYCLQSALFIVDIQMYAPSKHRRTIY